MESTRRQYCKEKVLFVLVFLLESRKGELFHFTYIYPEMTHQTVSVWPVWRKTRETLGEDTDFTDLMVTDFTEGGVWSRNEMAISVSEEKHSVRRLLWVSECFEYWISFLK